jgi:glutamyl-tRNA synthetase
MVKERAVFVSDLWEQSSYFFEAPEEYDNKTKKKFWKEQTPEIVHSCLDILKGIESFKSAETEAQIKSYIEENELGFGKVMNPLRLAIVGAGKGPHLFDIMEMIGKEKTIKRLETALEKLK